MPNSPDAAGPIAATIAFLIGNYMSTLFVVGLIVAAVRILRRRDNRSPVAVSGAFLNTFVLPSRIEYLTKRGGVTCGDLCDDRPE